MRKIRRTPNGAGRFFPGQDLVVAGTIGKAGAAAALLLRPKELSARFSDDFIGQIRKKTEEPLEIGAKELEELGATEWETVNEGGVFAALWNLSGGYGQGISLDPRKIPADQEIIEVCELFDLNPYRLRSGECILLAADNGGDVVRALNKRGIRAAVIGKVESGIARLLYGAGGTGYLERPQPDEIEKIIGSQTEQEAQNEGKDTSSH